jgi:hypothetical protein
MQHTQPGRTDLKEGPRGEMEPESVENEGGSSSEW